MAGFTFTVTQTPEGATPMLVVEDLLPLPDNVEDASKAQYMLFQLLTFINDTLELNIASTNFTRVNPEDEKH